MTEKLTYSVAETAKILGISKPKAYELASSAGFPAFHAGGRILVSVDGLRRWVASQVEEEVGD